MIQLTKVPHTKLQVITKAMFAYVADLQGMSMTEDDKYQASIISCVYHDKIKAMLSKQYPSKTHKLSFAWHEASAMVKAFMNFQKKHADYLESAIIENYKTELHRQIV